MSSGTVFQRQPSAPLTFVTGCSPLLPTPRARVDKDHGPDGKHWGELRPTILSLLPTPSASMANYDEPPEKWLARAERLKEKHGNGNGAGMPLAVAVKLLPTPRADPRDATPRKARANWRPSLMESIQSLSSGAISDPPSDGGSRYTGLRLSPCFEEWMLGLPRGWSDPDCLLSATEFRSRSESSSADTSSSERPSG